MYWVRRADAVCVMPLTGSLWKTKCSKLKKPLFGLQGIDIMQGNVIISMNSRAFRLEDVFIWFKAASVFPLSDSPLISEGKTED